MFKVISAEPITKWLASNKQYVIENVQQSYDLFHDGKVVNPDSYFLKFPDNPSNRIIALPSSIESGQSVAGIKWISSFPENKNKGLNRASSAVLLNDRVTGYPIACIEGSQISSSRTAASAVLGANFLHRNKTIKSLAIVGTGLISLSILDFFLNTGWEVQSITVSDVSHHNAEKFIKTCTKKFGLKDKIGIDTIDSSISKSDMVVIATSAITPYISDIEIFSHNPTVLHISLRDLEPEIILLADNYADDISHACKANTSLHLAESLVGHHDFISGNITDLTRGKVKPNFEKPRIFSPFGMGMLDISLAYAIYNSISEEDCVIVDDFNPPSEF